MTAEHIGTGRGGMEGQGHLLEEQASGHLGSRQAWSWEGFTGKARACKTRSAWS